MLKYSSRGFTLIELMIVMAVIAVLAALAYPSYGEYVMKSRRGLATTCLTEHAQQMERRFSTSLAYNATTTLPVLGCATDLTNAYTFEFGSGEPTQSSYRVVAIPTGVQTNDVCGTLGLNQRGVKDRSTSEEMSNCWR
jgi:type IV pilus assembly protein PilE